MNRNPYLYNSIAEKLLESYKEKLFENEKADPIVHKMCDQILNIFKVINFDLAKNSDCKAIILATASGFTGRMMSHFRSEKPLFVATNSQKACNQLTLAWGVQSFYDEEKDLSVLLDKMVAYRKQTGDLADGDKVIVVFGSAKDNKEKMQMVGVKTV
jgi:pyruvate kinase